MANRHYLRYQHYSFAPSWRVLFCAEGFSDGEIDLLVKVLEAEYWEDEPASYRFEAISEAELRKDPVEFVRVQDGLERFEESLAGSPRFEDWYECCAKEVHARTARMVERIRAMRGSPGKDGLERSGDSPGGEALPESTPEERVTEPAEEPLLPLGEPAAADQSKSEQDDRGDRDARLGELSQAARAAYYSFLHAEAKNRKRLEDREAYEWLEEHGIEGDEKKLGQLADYELPNFETWSRYLRKARKATGEQKYTPRRGRPTGGSIVGSEQI